MTDETPQDKPPAQDPPKGAEGLDRGDASPGEMTREEKIAAAKAKAEALKAQRAAQAVPALATSENPGGQPAVAPQNPKIQALGTINQSVELRCEATEDQNMRRLLGGLGAYRNPLRNAWQVDYRYYAEALKRLTAAGYQIEGRDYLGRPLDQWAPARRGWTRIPPS